MAELMMTFLIVLALVVAGGLYYTAPLEEQADPFVTPPHAQAPWYFLFLQGLLKIVPKIVGACIIPGLSILLLFLLPYIDKNPSRRLRDRKIALTICALIVIALIILTYLGTPAFGVD
ncbi:MAG: hypothetical protein ACE5NP_07585 [Anaerolineae bacterium]